jgi:BASS family bile acid:Na+ symporter
VKDKYIHKISVTLAIISFLFVFILLPLGKMHYSGPFVIAFFAFLALVFNGIDKMKGYSFTTLIFSAVSFSMYYPHYFIEWNGFKLGGLIVPLIQLIMFGMGTSMSVQDFVSVIKTPKGVVIGVFSQFLIMPSMGYFLASISGFPPEIAAGIVLIGCSPSGLASNVMAYIAKANVALSITITSVCTLLAPVVTPLLMKLLAGKLVEINVMNMMFDIFKMIIIPIAIGLFVNQIFSGKISWLDKVMPLVSMICIAFIIVIITAAGRDSLLHIGPLLILIVLIHNVFGYFLGYNFARLFKMNKTDARTVAIEVGMQNGGLASGIAREMGKIATVGLAAAVFGPLMNITASILASFWSKRIPDGNQ